MSGRVLRDNFTDFADILKDLFEASLISTKILNRFGDLPREWEMKS